jgi:hypothetical protein
MRSWLRVVAITLGMVVGSGCASSTEGAARLDMSVPEEHEHTESHDSRATAGCSRDSDCDHGFICCFNVGASEPSHTGYCASHDLCESATH